MNNSVTTSRVKLGTHETVRYNGPQENGSHGSYTMILENPGGIRIEVKMSLEATIQLKQRLDAALAHMITH